MSASQLANPDGCILDEIMHLSFLEQERCAPIRDRNPVALVPESRIKEFFTAMKKTCYGIPMGALHGGSTLYWNGLKIVFCMNLEEIEVRM